MMKAITVTPAVSPRGAGMAAANGDALLERQYRPRLRAYPQQLEVNGSGRRGDTAVKKRIAPAMAVALAVLSMGVAHADANDDDFVQQLKSVGVLGAPADLIRNAHLVCDGLASGSTPDDLADAFVAQMNFTSARAAKFVALSVTHYCPQYSKLPFNRPH